VARLQNQLGTTTVYVTHDQTEAMTLGDVALPAEVAAKVRQAGTGDAPGGSDQVVARLDAASRAHEGRQLQLWFDAGKLHLFNPENGAHLTR
jgi:multiple sugar transport system ATP-binding protein